MLPASGMAALIKSIASLSHRRLAPNAQLRMLHVNIQGLNNCRATLAFATSMACVAHDTTHGITNIAYSGQLVHFVIDHQEPRATYAKATNPCVQFRRRCFHFSALRSEDREAHSLQPQSSVQELWTAKMLAQTVADLIGEVDADAPLMEAGLDSLAAAELAAKLSGASGRAFAPTLVFNFPTLAALGAHLQTVVVDRDEEARPAVLSPAHARARACEDSTVHAFGASARLPGSVGRPLLLRVVAAGTSLISQAPVARWDSCPLGATVGQGAFRGGFIDGAQLFDAASFRISPAEAHTMDPQQRHVLEVTASALRRELPVAAGTGVFLGISAVEFGPALMHSSGAALSAFASTSSSLSVASGRVSYCLSFQGALLRIGTAARGALARHGRTRRE